MQVMKPPPQGMPVDFSTAVAVKSRSMKKAKAHRRVHKENSMSNPDGEIACAGKTTETGGGGHSMSTPKSSLMGNVGTSTKLRYEHYTPPSNWAELAAVPKMKEVPPDDDMASPVDPKAVKENDVLLGRGGLTNTNPGTSFMRFEWAFFRSLNRSPLYRLLV